MKGPGSIQIITDPVQKAQMRTGTAPDQEHRFHPGNTIKPSAFSDFAYKSLLIKGRAFTCFEQRVR